MPANIYELHARLIQRLARNPNSERLLRLVVELELAILDLEAATNNGDLA